MNTAGSLGALGKLPEHQYQATFKNVDLVIFQDFQQFILSHLEVEAEQKFSFMLRKYAKISFFFLLPLKGKNVQF